MWQKLSSAEALPLLHPPSADSGLTFSTPPFVSVQRLLIVVSLRQPRTDSFLALTSAPPCCRLETSQEQRPRCNRCFPSTGAVSKSSLSPEFFSGDAHTHARQQNTCQLKQVMARFYFWPLWASASTSKQNLLNGKLQHGRWSWHLYECLLHAWSVFWLLMLLDCGQPGSSKAPPPSAAPTLLCVDLITHTEEMVCWSVSIHLINFTSGQEMLSCLLLQAYIYLSMATHSCSFQAVVK